MEQTFFPVTQREAKRSKTQYSSKKNKNAGFPSRLRKLRKKKGVSQDTVSKELGVSKSTLGLWETGDTLPDAKAVCDLAVYYKVSTDYLLGNTDILTADIKIKEICELLGLSENAVLFIKGLYDEYFPTSEENPITTILSMLLESDNFMQVLGGLAIACNLEAESHENMDVKAIDKFIELHEQELKEIGATVWGAGPTSDMFLHQANYRFMECMRQVRSCFSPKQ